MPEKTITLADVRKRKSQGAEFQFDPDQMTIDRFDELLEALKPLAGNEDARIRADLARNATILEILGTLQGLIRDRKPAQSTVNIDMTKLEELLGELTAKAHMHPLVAYDFDFQRVEGGRIAKIRATPVKLTER